MGESVPKPFEPGNQFGKLGGRPKGSVNKETHITSVKSALILAGRHPVNELIELADSPKSTPAFKRDIWIHLLGFCEAAQIEPPKHTAETPKESVENAAKTLEYLEALAKPVEPKNDPAS
jgi:hypothetical protein